jgi:outer membrane murein-binding lipoprotein Lpp
MPAMKSLASVLFASALLFGCQNESKLNQTSSGGGGDLDTRVKKLEAENTKYKDMLDWLYPQYQKMKAQSDAQEKAQAENEPDPNATFAVDIAPDLKLGQVEGPPTACVTLVEAWDFA